MASKKTQEETHEETDTSDESLKKAVKKATDLLHLADDQADTEEGRSAAVKLVRHMKENDLVLVPKSYIERQAAVVGDAAALAEKAKKEQLTNIMIGGALGYLFGGGKIPGLK